MNATALSESATDALATSSAARRWIGQRLAATGVPEPRLEARLILAHALRKTPESLLLDPERPLGVHDQEAVRTLTGRRLDREPVAYIVGAREFWSLSFKVTRDTLVPRPDSETVVEAVLANVDHRVPLSILDLGTGSGCLLLALLHELPGAVGTGVDIAAGAIAVAQANADALGLSGRARLVERNWGDPLALRFDVIVANPPYVPAGEIDALAPEVARHEPRLALDGGRDGLDRYRELVPRLSGLLKPRALVALEVGQDQAAAVCSMLRAEGLGPLGVRRDLGGRARAIVARGR